MANSDTTRQRRAASPRASIVPRRLWRPFPRLKSPYRVAVLVALALHAAVLLWLILRPQPTPFAAKTEQGIDIDLSAESAPASKSPATVPTPPAPPVRRVAAPAASEQQPVTKPVVVPAPPTPPKPVQHTPPKPTPVPEKPVVTKPVEKIHAPTPLPTAQDGDVPPPPVVTKKPEPQKQHTPPPKPVPPKPVEPVKTPIEKVLEKHTQLTPAKPQPTLEDVLKHQKPVEKTTPKAQETPKKDINDILKKVPAPAGKAAANQKSMNDILKGVPSDTDREGEDEGDEESLDSILKATKGAKTTGGSQSNGKNAKATGKSSKGNGAPLSSGELEGVRRRVSEFWAKTDDARVRISVSLNPDGSVKGGSAGIHHVSGDKEAFASARRAILQAAPFSLDPDKYETWQTMEFNFDAQGVH